MRRAEQNGDEAEGSSASGRRSRPGLAVSALLGGKSDQRQPSPAGSSDGAKREDEDGYGQRRPMSRSSPRQISTASSKGDGGAAMIKGASRSTASPGAGDDVSHEGNPMAYQYTAVQQILENRENVEYQLTIREQPKHSRMCGVGEKADRRPIDPAPIIQLRVITHDGPPPRRTSTDSQARESDHLALSRRISNASSGVRRGVPVTTPMGPGWEDKAWYLENPYYFMYAMLADAETDEELHLLSDGKTRYTAGSCVSCLYHLKDIDGSHQGFFVFPDLSIRVEGRYRLKLCLFETIGQEVHHCKSIYSAPFSVYTAKRFPGMTESTLLSRSFADQGLKVRVRKNPRARRNRGGKRKSDGLSDDDSDDGGGYGRYPEGPADPYNGGRELKRVKSGPEPRTEPPHPTMRYDDDYRAGYGQAPPAPGPGSVRPRAHTSAEEWEGQRRYAGEAGPPQAPREYMQRSESDFQERERAMAAGRQRAFSNSSRGHREPITSDMPYYPSQPPPPPFMPGGVPSRGSSPPPPGAYRRPGGPSVRPHSPGMPHSHSAPSMPRPPHESPEARHPPPSRYQPMPPAPSRGGPPPPGYPPPPPREPIDPGRMRGPGEYGPPPGEYGPPPGEYVREGPPYRDDAQYRQQFRDERMPYGGDPYRDERFREREEGYYGRPGGPDGPPMMAQRGPYPPGHEAGGMPPMQQRAREVLPPPPPQTQVRRLSVGRYGAPPDGRPYESLPPPPGPPRGGGGMPPGYGGPPSPQQDRYGRSYPGPDISPRLPPPPPHGAPLPPPRTSSRRGPPH